MDSLTSGISKLKLSVLRNAAKISPFVSSMTIGPNSDNESFESGKEKKSNIQVKKTYTNLLVTVKSSTQKESKDKNENDDCSKRTVTIIDSEAISYNMYIKNLEKHRKNQVKKVMAERNARQVEAFQLREELYSNTLKNAHNAIINKSLESEKLVKDAIKLEEQLENQFNERQELQKREDIRRQQEKNKELQKIQEQAKHYQQISEEQMRTYHTYFVRAHEIFSQTLASLDPNFAKIFVNYQKAVDMMAREEILLYNNSKINKTTLDAADILCKNIDLLLQDFQKNIEKNSDSIKRSKEIIEEKQRSDILKQKEEEIQKNINNQNQVITVIEDVPDESECLLTSFISNECNEFQNNVKKTFEQYHNAFRAFSKDNSLKDYRFKLKLAIVTPINAIPVDNAKLLTEIYDKISAVLSGHSVKVSEGQVSVNDHPSARHFCTAILAEKIVDQGEQIISAGLAFPIAALVVNLWLNFPDFGNCFLYYLYEQCPFLIPFLKPQFEGQSDQEYYKSLGYRIIDGGIEKTVIYEKRIAGLTRLYAAVCITDPRRGVTTSNPHNLKYAWKWLTNILKLDPSSTPLCPDLIEDFISTAGHKLWMTYDKQFIKIIKVINLQYLPKLSPDSGGVKRLQLLLEDINKGKLLPPPGIIHW